MAEEALAVAAVLNRESDSAAVEAWAMQITGVKETHALILVENEVTGAGLLDGIITKSDLLEVGIPLEPAARIMKAIELARGKGGFREGFIAASIEVHLCSVASDPSAVPSIQVDQSAAGETL